MKTTSTRRFNLSQIMRNAHNLYKIQTGTLQSFADCLRKAWQNFKLVAAMRTRIVRFYFQKVDGSIREAWGTLRGDLLPATAANRKHNNTANLFRHRMLGISLI